MKIVVSIKEEKKKDVKISFILAKKRLREKKQEKPLLRTFFF